MALSLRAFALPVPEGDTIHRTAARLRPALIGRRLEKFQAPRLVGLRPRIGSTIEFVEATGKHLEIGFDDGIILHTHMRMAGSWHLYRPGETWRRRLQSARGCRAGRRLDGCLLQRSARRGVPRRRSAPPPGARFTRARPMPADPPISTRASTACRNTRTTTRRSRTCCSISGSAVGSATCTRARSCGRAGSIRARSCRVGASRAPCARRDRGRSAASEPGRRRTDHGHRRSRGVRPGWQAVLAVPHTHRGDPPGHPRPRHLLVPRLPAPPRPLTLAPPSA